MAVEQAAFRRGRETTDNIFPIANRREREKREERFLTFVNLIEPF